jgi:hypothetical protein
MGAPMGNRNAAGKRGGKLRSTTKSRKSSQPMKWVAGKKIGYKKMKAKGWYKKSGGRGVLKTIKRLSN